VAKGYRLPDEPRPGPLAHLVVHPIWPLFAVMFAGPWLSWTWFVLNGQALGSPTRWRELACVLVGFAGSFGLFIAMVALYAGFDLPERALAYLFVALTVWKLAVTYVLCEIQSRGFEIYTWYGGIVRNGIAVVIAGALLRGFGDGLPGILQVVLF
jgi:hypothetical protein